VPGLGASWDNGESACVAGEGSACLEIDGASEIVAVRVVPDDQTLYDWEGTVETDDLAAGSGPQLSVGSGSGSTGGPSDLVVTSVTASPSTPTQGEATTFDVTVENKGEVAANPSSTVEVRARPVRHADRGRARRR
jgi:hypothetical protein